jgi:hypothetical protein
MSSGTDDEPIDSRTSRSICEAVGKRLQQTVGAEASRLPSHLQRLMDELRRREQAGGPRSSEFTG